MDEKLILELLKKKDYQTLKRELVELNPIDIAESLNPLELHQALLLFRLLPQELANEVFPYFSEEQQHTIIGALNDVEIKAVIEELFFDDMVDLVEELPADMVKRVLKYASPKERRLINEFLAFPENSAGSLMTIEFITLRPDMTVSEALEYIKRNGREKETIYTCYVVDEVDKLIGFVSLREIVVADRSLKMSDIMVDDVIYVNVKDDQEDVANLFIKYGFLAFPVVDEREKLVGIITVDDIMEVIENEDTEDMEKMAAINPTDDPYLDTSVFTHARKRIFWLLVLMISGTITGNIIRGFNDALESIIILNIFIPMIMGTGGNSGNQSSTLITRGIATGEIEFSDLPKVVAKEFSVGIIAGVILAVLNFARLVLIAGVPVNVATAVSLTLIATVITADLVGGSLPILAKRVKIDPAIMAGSVMTTIVDSISLVVYFYICTLILHI